MIGATADISFVDDTVFNGEEWVLVSRFLADPPKVSNDSITAAANQAINWTNRAFVNSKVDLKFRLAHLEQVPFEETGDHNRDLNNLVNINHLPRIHSLRKL